MRERYAVPRSEVRDLEPVQPELQTARVNPDTVTTGPASQW